MPTKPKTPCRYPSCPELTTERYCEKHKKLEEKNYNQYQRNKKTQRFYQSKEWLALRKVKLASQPMCEECLRNGKYVKAKMVDHIKPIRQGGAMLDIVNLQSLCWSCHSRKSAEEGSRWGK
ncbi:MAG: HNH endonuclease [Bacillota bacterium]